MKKLIARIWFFFSGWKLDAPADLVEKSKHSVMIAAPHTSNWDFLYALFGFWLMGIDLKYFIKNDYTKGLHGSFFKWTGALGVDRSKKNNLVEHAVSHLTSNKQMVILVPAEGTRKRVKRWRKGFYAIAQSANVPISFGYLDYKNKIAGVGDVFMPTENYEADMDVIQSFYANINPKHPELYNPKIY